MKFIIVLFIIFVVAQAANKDFMAEFLDELQQIGAKCIPESGASDDDIASLLSHNPPETHEAKCLVFCYHKFYKLQNEDGSINKNAIREGFQNVKENDPIVYDKFVKLFDICTASVAAKSDPCEYAGDLAVCAIKEGHAMGLKEDFLIE